MWDKAVDDCLAALRFVPDWFVISKMIKKLFTALYADENTFYFNEDSSNVTFCCNDIGIFSVNLNNFNLDDTNYEEDDSDTVILIRLLAWHIKFKKQKVLKNISEELIIIAWHPKGRWKICVSEDEKKEIDPIFIEKL